MSDSKQQLKIICDFLNTYLSPKSFGLNQIQKFDEEVLLGPILQMSNFVEDKSVNNYCDALVIEKKTSPEEYAKFDINIDGTKAAKYIVQNVMYEASPVTHVLAHGSQVDGTYVTGWSDFDVILVVDLSRLKVAEDFIVLRKAIMKAATALSFVDPLCHHYFQIIPLQCMQYLSKSILPPSVLSECIFLHDRRDKLLLRYTDGYYPNSVQNIQKLLRKSNSSGIMSHHGRRNVYLEKEFKNADDNLYQLKYFYSLIAILPAFYYNLKGKDYSKPEAIENLRTDLNHKIDLSILFDSTNIRHDWGMLGIGKPIDNKIPDYIINTIEKNYFHRAVRFVDELC